MPQIEVDPAGMPMKFHHVHLFADALKPLKEYKALETRLNNLANKGSFDPFSGGMRFLQVTLVPLCHPRTRERLRTHTDWRARGASCGGAPVLARAWRRRRPRLVCACRS